MTWKFDAPNDAAVECFRTRGFVAFQDLLTAEEVAALRDGVEEACADGRLMISREEMPNNNDCVFAHAAIEAIARNPKLVAAAKALLGHDVNLQHSKLNAKPLEDVGLGAVLWHQDYPFFPHTNYDLVACLIHLDDEAEDAGPLRCIDGSHLWGPQSHEDSEGKFAYHCTDRDDLDTQPSTLLEGSAGMVTFHHTLTLHSSAPKRRAGHRRFVIFQYKARDAHQIAGAVWRCYGMEVEQHAPAASRARFADGSTVELRGVGGRLFDVAGTLAPDRKGPPQSQNARVPGFGGTGMGGWRRGEPLRRPAPRVHALIRAMKSTRKVLHVGGVGWNAYLNAKLMQESGDVAHVAANDIYHCVCSPEWHELADQGLNRDDLEDDFYPNFFRIAEAHAVRPRWFVQAPQILTIDYLYFLARGDTEIADGLWNTLQYNRFKAVLRRTTVPEGVRLTRREFDTSLKERKVARVFHPELLEGFGVERLTARFLRAASKIQAMAGYNPPYDPVFVDHVARSDDGLAEMVAEARSDRSSVKLGFERARFPPDDPRMDLRHFLGWDEHTRGERRQRERCASVLAEDAAPYFGVVPDWNRLFPHYDHRVLYGGSPIMGMLSQTPHYLAYEHGTIRSLPFEDNAFGRLIRASYLAADAVFITNGDYVTAKHRLEFEAPKRIYLPHAFDERPLLRFAQVNGIPKRAPGPARFFWPTRQDWTDHGPAAKEMTACSGPSPS